MHACLFIALPFRRYAFMPVEDYKRAMTQRVPLAELQEDQIVSGWAIMTVRWLLAATQ